MISRRYRAQERVSEEGVSQEDSCRKTITPTRNKNKAYKAKQQPKMTEKSIQIPEAMGPETVEGACDSLDNRA